MSSTTLARALTDLDDIVHTLEQSLDAERAKLDVKELAAWAKTRADVHERLGALERFVLDAIEEESVRAGHEPTLNALAIAHPSEVADMRQKISRVRALVRAMTASDARRHAMLTRARGIVRAYLNSLFPPAVAYGRAGEKRPAPLPSSTKATA